MDMKLFLTFLSWISASMVLLSFLLISQNKLKPSSRIYLLLNLFGSIGLATSAFSTKTYAFVLLNSVWGLVALITLIRITTKSLLQKNDE